MLPVNEVFQTLQGEATYTGTPALFIRLQGCGVGCPWCDTKHTWEVDPALAVSLADVLAKDGTSPDGRHAWASPDDLAGLALTYPARHVVITGGEPCDHDLRPLSAALEAAGKSVQVETSGTSPVVVGPDVWVTVSPKIGMPGGKVVHSHAVARADEIKMPVGKPADVDTLLRFVLDYNVPRERVWVQPLSRSPKATALCIDAATRHGWRVSVQTHAFLGVR